jgi:hypothetical protein
MSGAGENPQLIYEKWMYNASELCKDIKEFNIDVFASVMKKIYILYITQQGLNVDDYFYKSRKVEKRKVEEADSAVGYIANTDPGAKLSGNILNIETPIDELVYSNIAFIFLNHIESILDTDTKDQFVIMCKEASSACSEDEKRVSRHNYEDPPEAEIKNSEYKDVRKAPLIRKRYNIESQNPERCGKCFKFVPGVAGFQLTDGFLQNKLNKVRGMVSASDDIKNLHDLEETNPTQINNVYKELAEEPKKLFTIHVTLRSGKRIPSISFSIKNRLGPRYYTSFGFSFFSYLTINHTTEGFDDYLTEIKEVWERCDNVEECYYLHWLISSLTPFCRGSASFSKVILNAALLKCGLPYVKETPEYFKKSDWVALFTPTFDEYYAYIKPVNKMFYQVVPPQQAKGIKKMRASRKNKRNKPKRFLSKKKR